MNIIYHDIIVCMQNVLYVYKPKGISSFDVCYKLRKVLGTKKIGHTGTLDPNAEGVMIVLFNNATKANQFLVSDRKRYEGRMLYGIETDTLDIDGKIIKEEEYSVPEKEKIEEVLKSFMGKSIQEVPMTSAIKVDGKRLYQYQYEGKEVELPKREIEVFDIYLKEVFKDGFSFVAEVSSGTYIRSLGRDILSKLKMIGTLKELTRISIDDVDIDECDRLEDILEGRYAAHELYDVLSRRYKTFVVDNADDVMNGKRLKIESDEEYLLICDEEKLIAMYGKDGDEYRCIRGLL